MSTSELVLVNYKCSNIKIKLSALVSNKDVTHDIGDQWRSVKSGINQDTLQNAHLR